MPGASKKKLPLPVQEISSGSPSSENTPQPADQTPGETSQTLPFSAPSQETRTEIQALADQQIADALGTPVQLSDSQFRVLLDRLAATATVPIVPSVETPLISQPPARNAGNDPDDSPSDSSSHGSH
jgi:hypothetical protein